MKYSYYTALYLVNNENHEAWAIIPSFLIRKLKAKYTLKDILMLLVADNHPMKIPFFTQNNRGLFSSDLLINNQKIVLELYGIKVSMIHDFSIHEYKCLQ